MASGAGGVFALVLCTRPDGTAPWARCGDFSVSPSQGRALSIHPIDKTDAGRPFPSFSPE